MQGKRVVITGASGGIGLETARGLAAKGAELVMVVRSQARGEAAIAEIRKTAPQVVASLVLADLSRMADVRRAGAHIRDRYPRVDVLLNNAGGLHGTRELTDDGFEKTFAINHLAYFLLTRELRPVLVASAPARIVSVSSDAHKFGKLDLDDLQWEKRPYRQLEVYGVSKLCNILFARELATRLAGTGVTSNSVHPGLIASDFGREGKGAYRMILPLLRLVAGSVEKGARTSIWLASAPEVEGVTGKYFHKCKERQSSKDARDDELARRLWAKTEQLLGT
jgi:retinol dehydrogenase-12